MFWPLAGGVFVGGKSQPLCDGGNTLPVTPKNLAWLDFHWSPGDWKLPFFWMAFSVSWFKVTLGTNMSPPKVPFGT